MPTFNLAPDFEAPTDSNRDNLYLVIVQASDGGLTSLHAILVTATSVVELSLGDYNNNGIVDAAHYTVWRDHLGSATSLPNDDTPGVGQDDYTRWKTHFGQSAGKASAANATAAVHEPTTLALLTCATAGWYLRRGRDAHSVNSSTRETTDNPPFFGSGIVS